MWLGWGHMLGKAGFHGILWAEQPLLSSLTIAVMTMAVLCPTHWYGGRAQEETMDTASTSVPSESHFSSHSTMSLCKSLVPPACSQIGTGAQSDHVRRHKNLLVDSAPLRDVCCCYSLHLTQPLETGQPRIFALSYLLPLQGALLDLSLIHI